jgi:hypothetical protein
VKLGEWNDLCEREQAQGGEVIAASLTRASMQEMASDVLGAASLGEIGFFDRDGSPVAEPPPGTCGGRVGSLFNVAAGNKEVEFTPLAEADTVTVRDADGQTRTVGYCGPQGLEVLTAPAEGAAYRGVIIIEWPPPHGASPYSSMTGWNVSVTDALTGKPITTCTGIAVNVDVEALVTASLTMLADAFGEPLLDGRPVPDGDGFLTGTFPFLVSEMRVAER